jgi:hypothetical protein
MKSAELALLLRDPLLQLEGFVLKRRLLFQPPLDRLLRGIYFDSSGFDRRAFYLTSFVMPLCVPTNHLYFTFGGRVRKAAGGDRWNTEMPDLAAKLGSALKRAKVFLSQFESLPDFVAYAEVGPRTERTLEGLGYALARDGEASRAVAVFDELLDRIDMSIDWHRELSDRVGDLKRSLIESPEKARSQLGSCERQTVKSLGLEDFWAQT